MRQMTVSSEGKATERDAACLCLFGISGGLLSFRAHESPLVLVLHSTHHPAHDVRTFVVRLEAVKAARAGCRGMFVAREHENHQIQRRKNMGGVGDKQIHLSEFKEHGCSRARLEFLESHSPPPTSYFPTAQPRAALVPPSAIIGA